MTRQVIEYLLPTRGRDYVDATVGSGGHAEAILRATNPDGRLLGIDADSTAISRTFERLAEFGGRATLETASFADIADVARSRGFGHASGLLMDLGFSSNQVDDPGRGFSFRIDGPLDMRYDQRSGRSARDVLERITERDLADIIHELGEERRARRIARHIVRRRDRTRFESTADLAQTIVESTRPNRGRIHPATRTFQALRIYVNRELENLQAGLEGAMEILGGGGRLVVISFHSLEDRIVKNFIRDGDRRGILRSLTRKPLRPDAEEQRANPRSRSARLRAAEITA